MAVAQRAGLADLLTEHVRPGGPCGVNAHLKIPCLVAGMAAGADSIDDMNLLRHGAMPDLFGGTRAPSTLGSPSVIHLGKCPAAGGGEPAAAGRAGPAGAAAAGPGHTGVRGYRRDAKAGLRAAQAGCRVRHTKIQGKSLLVRGLNALAATISTPLGAPVIAAVRLRGGNANSARGAPGSRPRRSGRPGRPDAAAWSSRGRIPRITPPRSAAPSAGPVLGSRSR